MLVTTYGPLRGGAGTGRRPITSNGREIVTFPCPYDADDATTGGATIARSTRRHFSCSPVPLPTKRPDDDPPFVITDARGSTK